MSYKLENNDEEKGDEKVDSIKEASEKNSANKLKLLKSPNSKPRKAKTYFLIILSLSLFQKC